MTTAQLEHPIRLRVHGDRSRRERSARSTSRSRRAGLVSEAIVSGYIRDLAQHGRRVHGARAERPQAGTR
jgi:hypothetical protein